MADGSAPEISPSQIPKSESRVSKVWRSIREKFRKVDSHHSTVVNQQEGSKKDEASFKAQLDTPIIEVREARNLVPAVKLFFHTTPARSLEGIKSRGLLARGSDENVGENLGYSLYFGEEHQLKTQGHEYMSLSMTDKLRNLPDDYELTIWVGTSELRKGRTGLSKDARFYSVTPKTYELEDINSFFDATSESNVMIGMFGPEAAKFGIANDLRKLSPQHMIAAVRLDRFTREELLKNMILAEKASITADQIEERLARLFAQNKPQLSAGIDTNTLIHGLVASIEHSLIRASVVSRVSDIKALQAENKKVSPVIIEDALAVVEQINALVNDPVSVHYLESAQKFLLQAATSSGLDIQGAMSKAHDEARNIVEKKKPDYFTLLNKDDRRSGLNYYGGSNTEYAAYLLRKEMGIK